MQSLHRLCEGTSGFIIFTPPTIVSSHATTLRGTTGDQIILYCPSRTPWEEHTTGSPPTTTVRVEGQKLRLKSRYLYIRRQSAILQLGRGAWLCIWRTTDPDLSKNGWHKGAAKNRAKSGCCNVTAAPTSLRCPSISAPNAKHQSSRIRS